MHVGAAMRLATLVIVTGLGIGLPSLGFADPIRITDGFINLIRYNEISVRILLMTGQTVEFEVYDDFRAFIGVARLGYDEPYSPSAPPAINNLSSFALFPVGWDVTTGNRYSGTFRFTSPPSLLRCGDRLD